jgi:hypothetical protein
MSFLRDLQSKSQTAKANYAFAFASVITGLIVIVWISTIPARFSNMKGNENRENNDTQQEGVQAGTEFFDTAKSQLGNIIDWNKTERKENTEEAPLEYAPNMANLNLEAGDTVYAESEGAVVPVAQKEDVPVPEPDLERIPGITMPADIKPQDTAHIPWEHKPEPSSQTPVSDSGEKKVLIEVTKIPPKPILIETKTEPQEAPQN